MRHCCGGRTSIKSLGPNVLAPVALAARGNPAADCADWMLAFVTTEAADGPVASSAVAELHSPGGAHGYDFAGNHVHLRRRQRHAGGGAHHQPGGRMGAGARSRAEIGRSLHGRHLRGRARLDRRRAVALHEPAERAAALGAPAIPAALPRPPPRPVQSAQARAPQRGASLRPRRPALFAVPRRRPAIQLRLFRDPRHHARRRPARQEAASRRQAAARQARQV